MEAVVRRFFENLSKGEAISKRCSGLKCTLGFEIPDMVLSCHTDFLDGVVSGGIREVQGASTAVPGVMTFSGDMNAAMGLQVLEDDMGWVYLASKQLFM